MNKLNKLFAGFAAVAMLAACSNDEPTPAPVPENPADGEVAYMTITLTAPESGSRYTEDGLYQPSDAAELEHTVNSVQFLFFNASGAYAFTANADNTQFVPATSERPNVEYIGSKNVLILNGVRKNDYPEYVITVLNAPAGFTAGQTLQETADKLTAYAADFSTDRKAPFVMTTSSFLGDKNGASGALRHDAYYFATKLHTTDFKTTVSEAQNNDQPVEIYVERLAAKVEVNWQYTTEGRYEEINNEKYYVLNQTLAGGADNDELIPGEGESDAMSDVMLYVKVLGWHLNATAKESYMSKKLQTGWENGLWTGWNKAEDWRSFWGQAWTYGNTDGNLTYYTPSTVVNNKIEKGDFQYCYENTNAPANIFAAVEGGSLKLNGTDVAVKNADVTHVVLRTQIYQKTKDENGNVVMVAPSLVQYRGVLFTEASYKAMLLNELKAAGNLNFWHYVGESATPGSDLTTSNWKSVSVSDFVMKGVREQKLGQIKIVAKPLEGEKIYKRVEVPAEGVEGTEGYKPATVKFEDITATFEADVNALLATEEAKNPAVGTDNGDAFYYIPVEHLAATQTEKNAVEGYYGVVRNHWYKLTVNSFKKVGHLVFDPEHDETTPIKPEGPEDPLYYVGAKINILSWKVVNQTVDDL